MAKKKDYIDKLADAATELNQVMGLDPQIQVEDVTQGYLEKQILEASNHIEPQDEFSKQSQKIIDQLREQLEEEEEEEADESDAQEPEEGEPEEEEESAEEEEESEAESVDLENIVKGAKKRRDLRDIAKQYNEFSEINLKSYESTKELREAMLELLSSEESGNKEDKFLEPTLSEYVRAVKKKSELEKIVEQYDEFQSLREKLDHYPGVKALRGAMMKVLEGDDKKEEKSSAKDKPKAEKSSAKDKPKAEKGKSQTEIIRDGIRAKKSRDQILDMLSKNFNLSEGRANTRMKLYEKAYGEMGKDDKKL